MRNINLFLIGVMTTPLLAQTGLTAAGRDEPARAAAIQPAGENSGRGADVAYVLGPDDQVLIRVVDIEEVPDKPFRIDMRGNINVPLIGRVHAAGLTIEQLEAELTRQFGSVLKTPVVTVFLSGYRSAPISVLGAVKNPGVHEIHGRATLFEVLSLAGGLSSDAGNSIIVTRRKDAGKLALANEKDDESGEFQVGSVTVKSVTEARNPRENITVLPNDVVSVPKADLVYVIGAVKKAGGFVLNEKEKISVLQALSLAEGLDRAAASKDAKILRPSEGDARQEIPVNLKEVLAGKSGDVALRANDILFVPTSGPKTALGRGVEAAISIGTGIAIYRH
jgi:polysaccharide export outer membrane protein